MTPLNRIVYEICVQRGGLLSTPTKHFDKKYAFKRARRIKRDIPSSIVLISWSTNGKDMVAVINKNGDWEMVNGV